MDTPIYKRILLKLSGEALAPKNKERDIIDFDALRRICEIVKCLCEQGVEVALLVGGGNIWRGGRNAAGIDRAREDDMGMLATMINSIAIENVLKSIGVDAVTFSSVEMNKVARLFTARAANECLNAGKVIVLGGGTGNPFFTTDTGAILRAVEINADIAMLAKNVDAIYTADPNKDDNAKKYDTISYSEVLEKKLKVIDASATCMAMDNALPVLLFGLDDPNNIMRAICGENIGTIMR